MSTPGRRAHIDEDDTAFKGAAMADTYSKNPDAIARLSAEQRRVTQEGGTEPAFRNE
jgi:hypothetical protein